MRRINSQVMKNYNVLMIIRTVQQHAPISRTALTNRVGLTTASVINITNALIDAGILLEAGRACHNIPGRKAVMLEVNAEALYTVGIELSTEVITVAVSNFRAEFVCCTRQPISPRDGMEPILDKIVSAVEQAIEKAGVDRSKILGVGLSAPGPLDSTNGIMINPPNFPDWNHVPVKEILQRRLNLPVCCDKESNAAAMAEYYYGAAVGYKTTFFLSMFRLGIGGGLISGGNVFHGFRDGAGEIGHTTVDPSGPQCTCGSYGCLEAMVSGAALVRQAQQLYKLNLNFAADCDLDVEALSLEELFSRSEAGDEVCLHVVKQAAVYIATALGNVINLFSPELIVLGGTMARLSPQLVSMIREHISLKKYPSHCPAIRVIESSFGELTFAKGAIVLAMNEFLPAMVEADL